MRRAGVRFVAALTIFWMAVSGFAQTTESQDTAKLKTLRDRAEQGDSKAQFELGFSYENGTSGAQRDYSEALKWYRKAAEQGNTDARFSIAQMYFDGTGIEKDYEEAARWYRCPKPAVQALAACREIKYEDLPPQAVSLLKRMKCDMDPDQVYGSAVDLNGDGNPEYQVCCHDAPHGPCGAVVIGKVGSEWKELNPVGGVLGYGWACGLFLVLESRHNGFSDVCLPNECSGVSPANGKGCVPTIWHFVDGRYRPAE